DQARSEFDHGHLAAETAIHLSKLKADVAAPEDNEMRGKKIDIHHRAVGQVRNLVEAGDRGNRCARANVEKDVIRGELRAIHCHFLFRNEATVALINRTSL